MESETTINRIETDQKTAHGMHGTTAATATASGHAPRPLAFITRHVAYRIQQSILAQ